MTVPVSSEQRDSSSRTRAADGDGQPFTDVAQLLDLEFYGETGVRKPRLAALTRARIRAVLAHVNREELPIVAGVALGLILSLFLAS